MPESLQQRLVSELERVVILRERYRQIEHMSNVVASPQISMMTSVINMTKAAVVDGCPVGAIRALRALEQWKK